MKIGGAVGARAGKRGLRVVSTFIAEAFAQDSAEVASAQQLKVIVTS